MPWECGDSPSLMTRMAYTVVLSLSAAGCIHANAVNATKGRPYGHAWVCAGYAALVAFTVGRVWG